MIVIRAQAMGMCFGVRDAIELAEHLDDPASVTIHGHLVHNEEVLRGLERRGLHMNEETARADIPETPRVMITAHGVSDRERRRLAEAGRDLIDTTCPLVRRAHAAALALAREGRFVVVIGKRDHVEVQGLIGDLNRCDVVARPEDVRAWPAARLGVLCQTTTPPADADRILAEIHARNPGADIRYISTICRPTRDRQAAVAELLGQVEALVVVGGRHSNNTRQLAAMAAARGKPALHVQTADDLDPAWFAPYRVVGLTAGTSTPDDVIDAVHERLASFGAPRERARRTAAAWLLANPFLRRLAGRRIHRFMQLLVAGWLTLGRLKF